MLVSELIELLKTLDPDLYVMFDQTKEGDKMYTLCSIDEVSVATTDNEKLVVLSCEAKERAICLN